MQQLIPSIESAGETHRCLVPVHATEKSHLPYQEQSSTSNWETLAVASQFRLSALANLCQVSLRTLQRHFRKNYNTTLSEWIRELRLERARTMLPAADCVKFVAFELGYKQPSHFTRDFKQRYGIPPSALRLTISTANRLGDIKISLPSPEARVSQKKEARQTRVRRDN